MRIDTSNATSKDKTSCLKIVLKSKIMYLYLIYTLIGTIAMSTTLGLKMLTLTNYFSFSDNMATVYLLVIELLADVFGIIVLKYLTSKKDYLTITLKFGIRFLGESIGVFLCVMMYEIGLRYMFELSALFMVFQIYLAYYMIYLREQEFLKECKK